jgi:hypothetical protein
VEPCRQGNLRRQGISRKNSESQALLAEISFLEGILMKTRSFLALFGAMVLLFTGCDKVEAKKKQQLQELKEVSVPVRFRITDRANGKIKGEMQFYSIIMDDIDKNDMEYRIEGGGTLLASQNFELEGAEFFIDFLKYQEKSGLFAHPVYWVFPFRIYTDHIAPDQGTPIYGCYKSNDFPAVYNGFNLDEDKKQNLSRYYAEIMQYGDLMGDDLKKRVTGNAVHDMQKIASFQLNRWYDAAVHTKTGNIEYVAE